MGQFLTRILCHCLGYFYPAYQSYKAVKQNDAALHTQWLTFWIVNTYFSIAEVFGDTLLSWVPFYYQAKVFILIWLVLPYFNGATTLYEKVIDPYLHRYEKDIDRGVETVKNRSVKVIGNLGRLGLQHIRTQSGELMKLGHQTLLSQMSSDEQGEGKAAESS
uniref:HVA22-like protein n=1 Tax=Mucochytrium quahogii TaxID=96639 RepID=A0A7S2WB49_9STRA|mmetsp:Transcript_3039/g.4349  ORF Transcript_3039/g.4349 Transcript_3039/m.4349 type:complete len:162 (+) Transcript_3039:275-760(+)